MGELEFLAKLTQRLRRTTPTARLLIPPGDDAALVQLDASAVLFCSDMLLEGVHFDLAKASPELVGRKALAVNLSDLAAMAGTPRAAVVSLALPETRAAERLGHAVMQGIATLAGQFDVAVAGGDTTAWNGPLVIDLALIGEPHHRGSVTRGGARDGDVIYVTGPLGGSIHGRHLTFTPRVEAARILHDAVGIASMIDLSDGLAGDLRHILSQSGVGAVLDAKKIPIHADGGTLLHALTDGEDFELCLTLAPMAAAEYERQRGALDAKLGTTLVAIGTIVAAPGLTFADGTPMPDGAYEHGANWPP